MQSLRGIRRFPVAQSLLFTDSHEFYRDMLNKTTIGPQFHWNGPCNGGNCHAMPKRAVSSESALREEADVGHVARKATVKISQR